MNQNPKLSLPDVLAEEDCITGLKGAVEAVAHGKIIVDQLKSIFIEDQKND